MWRRYYDLILVIALTAVAVVLVHAGGSSTTLRAALAMLLVFGLPGYALMAAMFKHKAVGVPERILLSIGLSLAVVALSGFLLHWTGWGLQPSSWVLLLGSISVGASIVALVRQRRQRISDVGGSYARLTLRDGLLFGLAALIVVVAVRGAQVEALHQESASFTQLWILPSTQTDQLAIQLGVKSMESTPTRYKLRLEVDGQLVREWAPIVLLPNEKWENIVVLPTGRGQSEKVEAVLYRMDAPEAIYRRGVLWLETASK